MKGSAEPAPDSGSRQRARTGEISDFSEGADSCLKGALDRARDGHGSRWHLLRGTYRRDRHGPLPSNVVPMPAPQSGGWQPTQIEDLQTEINYHTWVRQQEAEKVPR